MGNTGSVPRLGLKSICLQDGPVGLRFNDYNSVFPAGMTAAATFDKNLLYRRGRAMGEENKGKGVHVILGPVAGPIGRMPEGGRNWEGFSPDPVLTGIAMASTINGIQDAGVIACAKHFVANEQGKRIFNSVLSGIKLTPIFRTLPPSPRSTGLRLQYHRDIIIQHRRQDHA